MPKQLKNSNNESTECVALNISIPCELAERVRIFAKERDASLTNIVIEALDAFLRDRTS